MIQGVIRGRAGPRDRADIHVDVCLLIISLGKTLKASKEETMKKILVLATAIVTFGATAWFVTPEQPVKYQLHVVSYGETMESIVKDSNRNAISDYDVRDAN